MAVVVFVAPHQDDETLSMGASIRGCVEAGHEVHTVLVTDGLNSGAQRLTGLNRPAFTRARDDEFVRASRALGVRFDRVHVSRHAAEAGALTVQRAEDAIQEFLDAHPGAWLNTYTHRPAPGRHVDHTVTGQAAVNLFTAGKVANVRLYVEPWALGAYTRAYPEAEVITERPAAVDRVRDALDAYTDVDRVGGRYGIGYQSVPRYFDAARADPVSHHHGP